MISLHNTGKKFSKEWIFRNLSYTFQAGRPVAIVGSNGSGKSTLVKAIAGTLPLNEGNVEFSIHGKKVGEDQKYKHLGISAPYLELIEEFTLSESIDFHIKFRPFVDGCCKSEFIEILNLKGHENKFLKNFSSGMKQKLKLGFAFYTQNDILILDEPTANIDQTGYEWYIKEVQKQVEGKIVIISSNEPKEYTFCEDKISLLDFKPSK